jgi:hypothetical protein
MKQLSILLLGLLALTSRAEYMIYKVHATVTVTGQEGVKRSRVTGFWVVEANTYKVADISIRSETFRVSVFTNNSSFTLINAGKGRFYTTLSVPGNGIGSLMATGLNEPLILTDKTASFDAPRTLKLTGNQISFESGPAQAEIESGTLVYDKAETVLHNDRGDGFDTAVSSIRQALLDRGLTEL